MALAGEAFLAIWHDVTAEGEAEYARWHTRQHMPERLSVPGFLRGRRGVDWTRALHRWLTIYEGAELATFGSPAYLARLNDPTEWSRQVAPTMINFVRGACALVASAGAGVGGAMMTLRYGDTEAALLAAQGGTLVGRLEAIDGVSAVHAGLARHDVSGAPTRESALRAGGDARDFAAALLIDGVGRRELETAAPEILRVLGEHGLGAGDAAIYDMAFCLTERDVGK